MMLRLTTASISPLRIEPVSVFASSEDAMAHLCDHVLTRPESHFWSFLITEFNQFAEPTDDRALDEFALALWNERRQQDGQHLYDAYAGLIRQNIQAGLRWSFYWEETRTRGNRWCGVGLGGVYVVWNAKTVITGMLVAYAAPTSVAAVSWHDRKQNPRPRKALRIRERTAMPTFPDNEDESTRYKIFKNCAKSVRREFLVACNEGRVKSGHGYMLGLQNIPPMPLWRALQRGTTSSQI